MPLYVFQCAACTTQFSQMRKLADFSRHATCQRCAADADLVIIPPAVHGDFEPYECPVTGKRVEGRKQHAENLARTGCRLLEPGEREDAPRRAREAAAAFDAKVDDSVERELAQWPKDKLHKLGAVLETTDISYNRDVPNA